MHLIQLGIIVRLEEVLPLLEASTCLASFFFACLHPSRMAAWDFSSRVFLQELRTFLTQYGMRRGSNESTYDPSTF